MARVEKSNSVVASFKEQKKQSKIETEKTDGRNDIICLTIKMFQRRDIEEERLR